MRAPQAVCSGLAILWILATVYGLVRILDMPLRGEIAGQAIILWLLLPGGQAVLFVALAMVTTAIVEIRDSEVSADAPLEPFPPTEGGEAIAEDPVIEALERLAGR